MQQDDVLVERRGPIQLITLNRQAVRNALDANVGKLVCQAVDDLESDDSLRVGVLTGGGEHFSSGMDLKAFLRGETPVIGDRGLCGITQAPLSKPLIAAVEGWALAGGFELALACDIVVASETARFGVPEVKRSLVAAAGGAMRLARRIPPSVAHEMLLTGEPIDANRALAVGLVNRVATPGTALEAALGLAETIANNGPLAVRATKRIIRDSEHWQGEFAWEMQDFIVSEVSSSEDAREGARAFAEKRPPVWVGR